MSYLLRPLLAAVLVSMPSRLQRSPPAPQAESPSLPVPPQRLSESASHHLTKASAGYWPRRPLQLPPLPQQLRRRLPRVSHLSWEGVGLAVGARDTGTRDDEHRPLCHLGFARAALPRPRGRRPSSCGRAVKKKESTDIYVSVCVHNSMYFTELRRTLALHGC